MNLLNVKFIMFLEVPWSSLKFLEVPCVVLEHVAATFRGRRGKRAEGPRKLTPKARRLRWLDRVVVGSDFCGFTVMPLSSWKICIYMALSCQWKISQISKHVVCDILWQLCSLFMCKAKRCFWKLPLLKQKFQPRLQTHFSGTKCALDELCHVSAGASAASGRSGTASGEEIMFLLLISLAGVVKTNSFWTTALPGERRPQ